MHKTSKDSPGPMGASDQGKQRPGKHQHVRRQVVVGVRTSSRLGVDLAAGSLPIIGLGVDGEEGRAYGGPKSQLRPPLGELSAVSFKSPFHPDAST